MIEFKSIDTFEIKGRGRVYTTISPEDYSYKDVYDSEVSIDGKLVKVIGIEYFPISKNKEPEICKGEKIGLLVKETNV